MRHLLLLTLTALGSGAGALTPGPLRPEHLRQAAEYSRQMRGSAVVVWQGGREVFAQGQNGFDLHSPHPLASGSKSFGCALAAALADEGRLRLDERVSDTLSEWRDDPRKSAITVRHLLNFTSGLPGRVGAARPRANADLYGAALAAPTVAAPGERYTYGNAHLAAFGALVARKTGQDPAAYLQRRILDPLGVQVTWGRDQRGQPNLAGGASMTARGWASFGQLMLQGGQWRGQQLLPGARLAECFRGSPALAAYGVTWWLNVPLAGTLDPGDDVPVAALGGGRGPFAPGAPRNVVMAAGALNQRLYLLPDEQAVVVRFGEGGPWSDEAFLARLLGHEPQAR